MENWFLLYLVTRLGPVEGVTSLAIVAGGIGAVVFGIAAAVCRSDGYEESTVVMLKWFKRMLTLFIAAIGVAVVVPSKDDVFFIIGGSALIEAAKTDTAKRIGSKSLEAVEAWLDEHMPKEPSK